MIKKTRDTLAALEKPDDEFFSHELMETLEGEASTRMAVDFCQLLGDTIKEKYESIYIKMCELANVLIRKGAKGYFWIVTSPEIASIFETATVGFQPYSGDKDDHERYVYNRMYQMPLGISIIQCKGVINCKWRLYSDSELKSDMVLMGAGFSKKPPDYYGVMILKNFLI